MYSDSMETLEEAKDFIRLLYAQVQEKNSREEMLMQEIASLKRLVSQKEKDTDTINRLISNTERLMHEFLMRGRKSAAWFPLILRWWNR